MTESEAVMRAQGFTKAAEEGGEGGGAIFDLRAVVELYPDRIRLLQYNEQNHTTSQKDVLLTELGGMTLRPCSAQGGRGHLEFWRAGKNPIGQFLNKALALKIEFAPAEEASFARIAEALEQEITARVGAARTIAQGGRAGRTGKGEGSASASSPVMAELEALEKLADLRAKGVLTEEEFEAKKRQILKG